MRKLLVVAALAALAFAPAPFPRTARQPEPDDLKKLQGVWVQESLNGRPVAGESAFRIQGERAIWEAPGDVWVMKLDRTRTPTHVTFTHAFGRPTTYLGVYRLEGDTFTYNVRANVPEAQRPLDFDTRHPLAYVAVYRRKNR
jgi:uncharacterized protein (TIGR03067 family)